MRVSNLLSQITDSSTSKQIEIKNKFKPLERLEIEELNSIKNKPKKTHQNRHKENQHN